VVIPWEWGQESPAIADKPARRESLPKLLQFDVPTTLSLTMSAYLHAFNCYCIRNLRNPEKFTENSNLWSSRSSKVIDIGVNRKPICNLLLQCTPLKCIGSGLPRRYAHKRSMQIGGVQWTGPLYSKPTLC